MQGVLIDSNFFIDRTRQGVDPFEELGAAGADWEIATCGVVALKVLRGVINSSVLERFRMAFSVMMFVPTGNGVWERAWRLAWQMDRAGKVIPAADLMIAAHAMHAGIPVLTADNHFRVIPGLKVLNSLA